VRVLLSLLWESRHERRLAVRRGVVLNPDGRHASRACDILFGSSIAHAVSMHRHARSFATHARAFMLPPANTGHHGAHIYRPPRLPRVHALDSRRHSRCLASYLGPSLQHVAPSGADPSRLHRHAPRLTSQRATLRNHPSCPERDAVYIIATLGTSRLHDEATVMHAQCRCRHSPVSPAHAAPLAQSAPFTVAHGGTSPRNVPSPAAHDPIAARHAQSFKQHVQHPI
jgi:hypothetical protein